jgi:hypothetical protein
LHFGVDQNGHPNYQSIVGSFILVQLKLFPES